MIDTIKVNNKTIPWLMSKEGLKYPLLIMFKTENVDGRSVYI